MSRFFRLIQRDNLVKHSFIADKWDLKGFERKELYRGQALRGWPEGVSFIASTQEMAGDLDDFVVNDADVPLVTDRVVRLLSTLKVPPFQALQALAVWPSHRREAVFVLNFSALVPGLDLQKTKFERYPKDFSDPDLRNRIWFTMAPVLIRKAVLGWDFFRCEEYPNHLFASERFKHSFGSKGMTGVSFAPVQAS
ncbi:MAG TPA: DUF1629 domain-containing protein [Verrucomicrobiae bacterium]